MQSFSLLKTKVTQARKGSPSAKTTVPQFVLEALKLGHNDYIEWMLEAEGSKLKVCVSKSSKK